MAKKSAIERDKKRTRLAARYENRRATLKAIAKDEDSSPEERCNARRNSAPSRQRLRCTLSGRPRGNYRKFKISRIALRELALSGQIPGMVKSSW